MADTPPRDKSMISPLLTHLVVAWVPFALGLTAVVFVSILSGNVAHARAQYSIWLALLLAAPAWTLFARDIGRQALGELWRLFWTLALAAYAFHLWYGYVVLFRSDTAAVAASQGLAVALGNTAISVFWTIDVVCAWSNLGGRLAFAIRVLAHVGVLVAGVASTLVFFRNDTAATVGVILILAAAYGLVARLRTAQPQ